MFIPPTHIYKYGYQYESSPKQHVYSNTFLDNTLTTERRAPTLAPVFAKNTATSTNSIAANTIPNNEISTEVSTSTVQDETDNYSTTPSIETTTDVVNNVFISM